jgi:hypothetical protein
MKTSKIVVKGDKVVSVSVPVYFFAFKEDSNKYVYAECPSLELTTYGDNLKQAQLMFKDAFNLWIQTVNEDCNIKKVLEDLGWTMTKSSVIPKEDNFKVPFEILASKSINLQIPIRL